MLEDSNVCYVVVQVPVDEEIIQESIIVRGIRQGSPFKLVQVMASIYGRQLQNLNGNKTHCISGPLCADFLQIGPIMLKAVSLSVH